MKKYLFILGMLTFSVSIFAQELLVSTTGVLDFNHGFTSLNEAGTDFQSPVVSSSYLYLSIEYNTFWDYFSNPDKEWSINIHKTDINWHQNLSLEVMRDGNGSHSFAWFSARRPLIGGTSYSEVTDQETVFFEGSHGISNIPIKVRVAGASVTMGANDYSTTIFFTVYEK